MKTVREADRQIEHFGAVQKRCPMGFTEAVRPWRDQYMIEGMCGEQGIGVLAAVTLRTRRPAALMLASRGVGWSGIWSHSCRCAADYGGTNSNEGSGEALASQRDDVASQPEDHEVGRSVSGRAHGAAGRLSRVLLKYSLRSFNQDVLCSKSVISVGCILAEHCPSVYAWARDEDVALCRIVYAAPDAAIIQVIEAGKLDQEKKLLTQREQGLWDLDDQMTLAAVCLGKGDLECALSFCIESMRPQPRRP